MRRPAPGRHLPPHGGQGILGQQRGGGRVGGALFRSDMPGVAAGKPVQRITRRAQGLGIPVTQRHQRRARSRPIGRHLDMVLLQALHDTAPAAPQLVRHGFEIVDKRSGKEVYLDGSWAEMFQQQILAWQRETPTQEEVEDTLDRYAGLAQNPVVVH